MQLTIEGQNVPQKKASQEKHFSKNKYSKSIKKSKIEEEEKTVLKHK